MVLVIQYREAFLDRSPVTAQPSTCGDQNPTHMVPLLSLELELARVLRGDRTRSINRTSGIRGFCSKSFLGNVADNSCELAMTCLASSLRQWIAQIYDNLVTLCKHLLAGKLKFIHF